MLSFHYREFQPIAYGLIIFFLETPLKFSKKSLAVFFNCVFILVSDEFRSIIRIGFNSQHVPLVRSTSSNRRVLYLLAIQ